MEQSLSYSHSPEKLMDQSIIKFFIALTFTMLLCPWPSYLEPLELKKLYRYLIWKRWRVEWISQVLNSVAAFSYCTLIIRNWHFCFIKQHVGQSFDSTVLKGLRTLCTANKYLIQNYKPTPKNCTLDFVRQTCNKWEFIVTKHQSVT